MRRYLSCKASEREAEYWGEVYRQLYHRPASSGSPGDGDAGEEVVQEVLTREVLAEVLDRAGNPSARIVPLSSRTSSASVPMDATKDGGTAACLAPAPLRSTRELLAVDVVLETDDVFYLVSPHLQHNLKVRPVVRFTQ